MDAEQRSSNQAYKKLNSAEQGKLWATYMGNSMAICVLKHMLHHVDDQEIKKVLEDALNVSEQFVKQIKDILTRDNYLIPIGFTEDDVDVQAPRLFEDEFYLHYLKYASKAGLSVYGIALPLMVRPDVRAFFTYPKTKLSVRVFRRHPTAPGFGDYASVRQH